MDTIHPTEEPAREQDHAQQQKVSIFEEEEKTHPIPIIGLENPTVTRKKISQPPEHNMRLRPRLILGSLFPRFTSSGPDHIYQPHTG